MARKDGKDRGIQEETKPCPRCGSEKCAPCKQAKRRACPSCPCSKCSECKGTGRKGTGIWWVRYADEFGNEHREKVGTKTAAREVYAKRKTEVRQGKFHPEDVQRRRKLLVKDAIKGYLEESRATKRTWKDDERYGAVWTTELGDKALDAVKPADVEAWRRKKAKDGVTVATVNRHVAFLKRVFNVMIRDERCAGNPVAKVKMHRENNTRLRFLTADEETRLEEACPPEWWPAVVLAIQTGLRASEQFGLRWEHIDFLNGVITIPRSKHGEKRHVPMNARVKQILRDMPSRLKSPWVFPGVGDEHYSICHLRDRVWRPTRKKAGLEDVRWHDLRHTFASRLVMKGADLRSVQELMGHKTILMTQRYAHLAPSHLQRMVDLLCEPDPQPSPKPSPSTKKDRSESSETA